MVSKNIFIFFAFFLTIISSQSLAVTVFYGDFYGGKKLKKKNAIDDIHTCTRSSTIVDWMDVDRDAKEVKSLLRLCENLLEKKFFGFKEDLMNSARINVAQYYNEINEFEKSRKYLIDVVKSKRQLHNRLYYSCIANVLLHFIKDAVKDCRENIDSEADNSWNGTERFGAPNYWLAVAYYFDGNIAAADDTMRVLAYVYDGSRYIERGPLYLHYKLHDEPSNKKIVKDIFLKKYGSKQFELQASRWKNFEIISRLNIKPTKATSYVSIAHCSSKNVTGVGVHKNPMQAARKSYKDCVAQKFGDPNILSCCKIAAQNESNICVSLSRNKSGDLFDAEGTTSGEAALSAIGICIGNNCKAVATKCTTDAQ